jgi:hypothetical protein
MGIRYYFDLARDPVLLSLKKLARQPQCFSPPQALNIQKGGVGCDSKELLIYTVVDEKYFEFGLLFPLFALLSNPEAVVEVGVSNYPLFQKRYEHLLDFYDKHFAKQVCFSLIPETKVYANSLRFLVQPATTAKYIYICDADILITQPVLAGHIANIEKNKLDFSNIKRHGEEKLTGLHFISFDKMFPLRLPDNFKLTSLVTLNDEILLYQLMQAKGLAIPNETAHTFRPVLGLHASFYSRPPLPTLTTDDKIVTSFPSWFSKIDQTFDFAPAKQYLKARRHDIVKKFMSCIAPTDVKLRQLVQYIDLVCEKVSGKN